MRFPVVRGAAVAALLLGWWAVPAGAHEGEAVVEVDAAHDVPPSSVHYIIKVTWADDGHAAAEADVTATAAPPDGSEPVQAALELSDPDQGIYQGQLDLRPIAGDWEVTFASINPEGTETATYTVAVEEPAEEEAPPAQEPTEESTESEGSSSEAGGEGLEAEPSVEAAEGDPESVSVTETEDDDDSPPLALLAAVFVVLGAVVAGVFWLVVNRKTTEEPGGEDDGGGGGGGGPGNGEGPDGTGKGSTQPDSAPESSPESAPESTATPASD